MRTITLATLTLAVAVTPLVAQNRRTPPPSRSQRIEQRALARHQLELEALARRLREHGLTTAERARLAELATQLQQQEQVLSETQRAQLAEIAAQAHVLSQTQRAHMAELQAETHVLSQTQRAHIAELQSRTHVMSEAQQARIAEMSEHARGLTAVQREQIQEMAQAAQALALRGDHRIELDVAIQAAQESAAMAQEAARGYAADAQRASRARTSSERNVDFARQLDRYYGNGPRVPNARQQDPADSVYRAARDRLSRSDFAEAARLFGRIRQEPRFVRSGLRAEAFYWEAFALGRLGTGESLRRAQEGLGQLMREYTSTQRPRDTTGLLTTINAQLAQLGSESAANTVRMIVDEARAMSDVARGVILPGTRVTQAEQYADAAIARGLEYSMARGQRSAQCVNDEAEIRLIALGALVRMDTSAAMPVLRDVMARRDECAAPMRSRALIIVNRIRSPEAENILFDAARNDPDAAVRQSALVWLSSRSPDRALSIGEDALRTAQDAETRQWALQTLAKTRNERAWRAIRDYAMRSDISMDDRRAAIVALGSTADSSNVAYLRELYGRVGERQLREAILMSTALRRSSADADWLITIALNEGEETRLREIAISRIRSNREITLERWITIYDRVTEKRVKQSALDVIASRARTEPDAVEKLISVARTEPDIDLRKKAVLSLADPDVNDPRARDLLIEIINRRL